MLDENISILALKVMNDRNQHDTTCRDLLRAIAKNCHSIVIGGEAWKRYHGMIQKAQQEKALLEPGFLKTVLYELLAPEKDVRWIPSEALQDIEGLKPTAPVDEGDYEFARAAASVPDSILVTTDSPFRNYLQAHKFDQTNQFTVCSPEEGLRMAGPDR